MHTMHSPFFVYPSLFPSCTQAKYADGTPVSEISWPRIRDEFKRSQTSFTTALSNFHNAKKKSGAAGDDWGVDSFYHNHTIPVGHHKHNPSHALLFVLSECGNGRLASKTLHEALRAEAGVGGKRKAADPLADRRSFKTVCSILPLNCLLEVVSFHLYTAGLPDWACIFWDSSIEMKTDRTALHSC